jgi:hypothetical protein
VLVPSKFGLPDMCLSSQANPVQRVNKTESMGVWSA